MRWELPNNVPFEAKKELIDGFINLWDKPATACFDKVALNAEKTLEYLVDKHFERFPKMKAYIL